MTNLVGDLTQRPLYLLRSQVGPEAPVEAVGLFRTVPADFAAAALTCAGRCDYLDSPLVRIVDRLERATRRAQGG